MASQVDKLVRAGLDGFFTLEKYGLPSKPKTITSNEAAQIYGGVELLKTITSKQAAKIYGGMELLKTITSKQAAQIYDGKEFLDKRKPFRGA